MRIAGVRLVDGRLVWVEAADHKVAQLDTVDIQLGKSRARGMVVVTPDQLVGDITLIQGVLVGASRAPNQAELCIELPGADMPPLGSALSPELGDGTVVQLDAVNRTVTVAGADGSEATLPWPPSEDDAGTVTVRESGGSAPAPRL